jgi:hypothetical protein
MKKLRSHKTVRIVIPILIILAMWVIAGLIAKYATTPGYVLFIYTQNRSTGTIRVAETQSGYRTLRECEAASQIYDLSVNGKQPSFARCAQECPIFAESERECNTLSPR